MSRSERRTARPCARDVTALSARASGSTAIQLPPLSSPRDGPPQSPLGREPTRDCDMHPSGGGCLLRVTSASDGYQLGLTPKCLGIMMAIGQSSTDSNLARNGTSAAGLRSLTIGGHRGFGVARTCHWARRTIPRNTTTRNRRADAWPEPRLVDVPLWDLPRQTKAIRGRQSRASRAAKRRETGFERATFPGLRACPAGGGADASGSSPARSSCSTHVGAATLAGLQNPAHFRRPPGFREPFPWAKEAARWLQPYAPCGRQQPPQQQLPIGPPESTACSRLDQSTPFHIPSDPALAEDACAPSRPPRFPRRGRFSARGGHKPARCCAGGQPGTWAAARHAAGGSR